MGYAHVLSDYTDDELKDVIRVANSIGEVNEADASGICADGKRDMRYKEAQIHGEVRFDRHVERLVASTRHKGTKLARKIEKVCKKHGWKLSWMEEEKERLRMENQLRRKDSIGWQERLSRLDHIPSFPPVAADMCQLGCGRHARPGSTSEGSTWTTCCKGCVMGFGHDISCGMRQSTWRKKTDRSDALKKTDITFANVIRMLDWTDDHDITYESPNHSALNLNHWCVLCR